MKQCRLATGGVVAALALLVAGGSLAAQQVQDRPLAPPVPRGELVVPYFDGWFENEDGSHTFSFGFFNRNQEELIEIPLGPDNFIEPAEFDGVQPTHFPVVSYGGFSGRRERGAFAVTVPPDFEGDVVWTLRYRGQEVSVPGRIGAAAYELSWGSQAAGSQRPLVRMSPDGQEGRGPEGVIAEERVTTTVGTPVELTFWGQDQGERDPRPLNMTWQKHQGPGSIEFSEERGRLEATEGEVVEGTTMATFDEPGEYVVRVRVDNFTAGDSSFADQCCWSNGYIPVTVTE